MSHRPPTLQEASDSYYPKGIHESPALKRARSGYQMRNAATGFAIVSFIVGVYFYSISAVKQDDFSDVVDLLPPPEERAKMRSIEDELRDKELGIVPGSAPAPAVEVAKPTSSGVMAWLPKRLDKVEWLQRRGWVEESKGNVLVWGAPSVDRIGSMRDTFGQAGRRQV